MATKNTIQTGSSVTVGAAGGPTIAYGTGVPSASKITGAASSASGTPTTGSQYIRTDGTSGARIYWYYGSWVAQTTP
jgi:hypothetical protein